MNTLGEEDNNKSLSTVTSFLSHFLCLMNFTGEEEDFQWLTEETENFAGNFLAKIIRRSNVAFLARRVSNLSVKGMDWNRIIRNA
ncbi:unnamed protein product [Citrullus colocynthis]|uniref:Uncharacterized protein n=1 Tax=Citrullus colocynthis TaxID=252529 RepID=A0ABP0Y3M1_9ROSI